MAVTVQYFPVNTRLCHTGGVEEKLKIAVFIDYDNIEIGVKSTLSREFDVAAVLEGLKERGEIVTKVAYANWGRQSSATRAMTENGVQMVQRDPSPRGDKNGADINLALDALEMAFTRDHINTFAIVSGDSDFMALVEKLKEYNKRVFIVGGKAFTSTILQRNCHEFISYESLVYVPTRSKSGGQQPRSAGAAKRTRTLALEHSLPLLDRGLKALERREVTPQLGLLKSTMLQLDPAFTERDYGTSAFSDFVQKLADAGHVKLHRRENNLIVERIAAPEQAPPPPSVTREEALPLLRSVLGDNASLLRLGVPSRELSALFQAAYPDFQLQEYGFTEFEELLNLAQDKGLLRIDAEGERGLRVFPGAELEASEAELEPEPVVASGEAEAAEEAPEPAPKKPSRRRSGGSRRSGSTGRRRSGRKAEAAPVGEA
jgi:uncharacterized protein (TIGR00288 family)